MKSDVIKRRLARGAATTVAATAFVMPHNQAFEVPRQRPADNMTQNVVRCEADESNSTQLRSEMVIQPPAPSVWDKHFEKEFRALALMEAKGELSESDGFRLDQLNHWRDELLCQPTPEEVLLRLKRDRLLSKMENILREYVEFQESSHQKRFTS